MKTSNIEAARPTATGSSAHGCNRCSLKGKCRAVRAATREHFRWSLHNLVAHPLSEIAWLMGMKKLSNRLHDASIPKHLTGNGRG
jgi:hypothetical protein